MCQNSHSILKHHWNWEQLNTSYRNSRNSPNTSELTHTPRHPCFYESVLVKLNLWLRFAGTKWVFTTNTGKRFTILKSWNQCKSSWLLFIYFQCYGVQARLGDCANHSWHSPWSRRCRRPCHSGKVFWKRKFHIRICGSPNYSMVASALLCY